MTDKTKTRRNPGRLIWAGMITALAVQSLVQDFMGKRRWLAYEAKNWWPAWITVPGAIVVLAVAVLVIIGEAGRQ